MVNINRNKAKGTGFEYRVMRALEKEGWTCIRSGSSHFPDIHAFKSMGKLGNGNHFAFEILCVECKNRRVIPKNPINLLTKEEKRAALYLIDRGLIFKIAYNFKTEGKRNGVIKWIQPSTAELQSKRKKP